MEEYKVLKEDDVGCSSFCWGYRKKYPIYATWTYGESGIWNGNRKLFLTYEAAQLSYYCQLYTESARVYARLHDGEMPDDFEPLFIEEVVAFEQSRKQSC